MQRTERPTDGRRIADSLAEDDVPVLDLAELLETVAATDGAESRGDTPLVGRVYRARQHLEFPYHDAATLAADIDAGLANDRRIHWITLDDERKV